MRKIGKFFFLPIFLRNLFLFIHIFQKISFFFYNIHFYFISNSQNNHTFTLYYSHSKRKTVFKQNSKKFFQKKIYSPIKFGLTYISFFIFYSFLLEHPSLGCSNFFTVYQSHTPPVLAQRWMTGLRTRPKNEHKSEAKASRYANAWEGLRECEARSNPVINKFYTRIEWVMK